MPLLVAVVGASSRVDRETLAGARRGWARTASDRSARLGLTAGVAYFAGTLYWITDVMVAFGGTSLFVGIILNALLVAYLALFPAAFALILGRLVAALGSTALLLSPAIWVATELARTHLFGGFPWVLLGYSQATVLPVAQLASLVGVYGLSALVVLVGATVAYTVCGTGRGRWFAVAGTLGCVLAVWGWGAQRVSREELVGQGEAIRVALVQGNVPQADKWDPSQRQPILETYLALTRQASARDADLIIWPESSTPFSFEQDQEGGEAVRRAARESGSYLLFGSDQVERASDVKYYNAAFLLDRTGATAAVYRKIHLVPFGEFVPLRGVLFFAEPLVEVVADFSPGDAHVTLPIAGHQASTAICYEVVYPDLIRQFVLEGSELLTTITNDAWYGDSSAPHQHFVQASMRAIEQGRYLLRAANTGVSGIVDPYGRVVARTEIFEPALVVDHVRFLDGLTFYGRTGDMFAYLCAAMTVTALLSLWVSSRGASRHRDRQRASH